MSFLAPWFLIGGLAIAGPILFHLIRRAARERMPFSSVMFLRPTPPRMTRRRRIEHVFLLLLRCACLLLLGAAFARPFFSNNTATPTQAGDGRQRVVLIDTSASMRRADVWNRARTAATRVLDDVTPADQLAVIAFDRQPHTLVSFAQWNTWALDERSDLARQQVSALEPGWMGTQLGSALVAAAEMFLAESSDGQVAREREIVVITDLQEGARLDGLQGYDWPDGVAVRFERVESRGRANAGLAFLSQPAGRAPAADQALQVRVTNARDSNRERFHLAWDRAQSDPYQTNQAAEIYLPPGHTRTFAAPALPDGISASELRLIGDDESFDNSAHFVKPETDRIRIAYWGADATNDPSGIRYYLERVFPETPLRKVEIVAPGTQTRADLLRDASFAVVQDVSVPQDAAALREWIAGGKTALFVVKDVNAQAALAAVSGLSAAKLVESSGDFALLGEIDFRHPLFAPFADPRFSDFTQIHFWKHRVWELPENFAGTVLARFDSGAPALVEVPVAQGRLLVLTSGWQPADSQLAVASKFPPLMHSLLAWAGAADTLRFQFLTGDPLPSPDSSATGTVQWRKPDGSTHSLAASASFQATDQPGIYTASVGDRQWRFAVDLPLDESRTGALPPDELARLGVPLLSASHARIAAKAREQQRYLHRAELENRQKLWRWILVAVLAFALAEVVLGGWLAQRIQPAEISPAPAGAGGSS
jgi:hypothetical protein